MKKIGIVLLIGLVLLTGCSKKDGSTTGTGGSSNTSVSENLYDFQVKIDGVVYQFPTTVEEFEKNGWELLIGSYDDKELAPGSRTYDTTFRKDGMEFDITIRNLDTSVLEIKDCLVVGLELDSYYNNLPPVELSKGVTFDSTLAEILEALGNPSDEYDGYSYYINYSDKQGEYSFTFESKEDGTKLSALEIQNDRGYEDLITIDPNKEYSVPEIVSNYQKSEAFTEDIYDFVIKLEGEFYQLPVPLSVLLEDGWVIVTKDIVEIPAYDYDYGFEIRKGNQVLDVTLMNYDKSAQIPENCFVVGMDVGGYNGTFNLELAHGVTLDSSVEELIAAFGEPTEITEYSYSNYYEFRIDYNIRYQFKVDNETNKIESVEITNFIDDYK